MSIISKLYGSDGKSLFTTEQLTEIESYNIPETVINDPMFIRNMVALVEEYGFNEAFNIIKNKMTGKLPLIESIEQFMITSKIFNMSRNIITDQFFKTLKQPRFITGFYKCKFCGSKNVRTRTLQTRSGDESSTDYNTCLNPSCGKSWRVD